MHETNCTLVIAGASLSKAWKVGGRLTVQWKSTHEVHCTHPLWSQLLCGWIDRTVYGNFLAQDWASLSQLLNLSTANRHHSCDWGLGSGEIRNSCQ